MPISLFLPQSSGHSLQEATKYRMDRDIQDTIVAKALNEHGFQAIAIGLYSVTPPNDSPHWNSKQVEAAFGLLRQKYVSGRSDVWRFWTACPHANIAYPAAHSQFKKFRDDRRKRLYEQSDEVEKDFLKHNYNRRQLTKAENQSHRPRPSNMRPRTQRLLDDYLYFQCGLMIEFSDAEPWELHTRTRNCDSASYFSLPHAYASDSQARVARLADTAAPTLMTPSSTIVCSVGPASESLDSEPPRYHMAFGERLHPYSRISL